MAAAQLAYDLAIVGISPWHRAHAVVIVGHANNEPAAARIGKRGDNLGILLRTVPV